MRHDAEREMARNLAALRALPKPMEVIKDVALAEQVWLNWDNEAAEMRAQVLAEPGALATIEAEVSGIPRWLSLSVVLGEMVFNPGEVMGLALTARAAAPFSTAPFLRTGTGSDERNSRLGDAIGIGTVPGTAVRLLKMDWREAEGLARHAMVILPLPEESFRFTLVDMRLFILPAGAALETDLPGLGSQAV